MSRTLLQDILSTIPADCLPSSDEPFVMGISGGPDSMALALLLQEINETEKRGWRLHLAHLNHGLRGAESDRDAEFVADFARRHGWEATIETRAVKEPADRSGLGVEEAARNERYAFFERVLAQTGAKVVATAHHADDNVETVLHRLIRGTGVRGLSGIPAVRPLRPGAPYRLIRPLLNIRRAEILTYLKENEIASCHDHTNETTETTRNRIRNELIPQLERDYNPALGEALLRLAEQSQWIKDFLQESVDERFVGLSTAGSNRDQPKQIVLDALALLRQPRILQTELARRAFVELGAGEKKLTFDHLVSIVALAKKNVSGKRLELPGGVTVAYDRKKLTFARASQRRDRSV